MGFFSSLVVPNVRVSKAPFFAYRGGKVKLRRYIIRWFPQNGGRVYCEPFVGRANVFFACKSQFPFSVWHLNDLRTIPFLKAVLEYDGRPFPSLTRSEFIEVKKVDPVLSLLLDPIYTWCGDGISPIGHDILHANHDLIKYSQRILLAKKLLGGVILTNVDGLEVIKKYLSEPNVFLYLDPPYKSALVNSYFDYDIDREFLWKLLKKARCKWILSEYWQEDIIKVLGEPFTRIKGVVVNPSEHVKPRRVDECLWKNFGPLVPNNIDLSYSGFPVGKKTWDLFLKHGGGDMSFSAWNQICPDHWNKNNRSIEFYTLVNSPKCYFDGERLKLISQMQPV